MNWWIVACAVLFLSLLPSLRRGSAEKPTWRYVIRTYGWREVLTLPFWVVRVAVTEPKVFWYMCRVGPREASRQMDDGTFPFDPKP